MTNRLIHVARDGKVIGRYPPEQLASLSETGHFLETDLCYSEARGEWISVTEFLKIEDVPRFARIGRPESVDEPSGVAEAKDKARSRRHSRRSSRRKENAAMLGGWIAFLLALAALAGAVVWITVLYSEIGNLGEQLVQSREKLAASEREYQRLLFVSRETAEPGSARGRVILRNESGKRIAVPGLAVSLYKRQDIENFLDRKFAEMTSRPADTNPVAFLLENLPAALASTSTDASGRFEFTIPEPGEYVVFSTMGGTEARGVRLWFVGFDSRDPINSLIEVNESNSVQQLVRSLMVVQGR